MNYKDAETPMQVITGNAVGLETLRYEVGSVALGGMAGALLAIAGMGWKERRRERDRETR